MNLASRVSFAIERRHNFAEANEPAGSRQIKRSFHGGHSLMHGATTDIGKKAPREYGLDRGASIGAFGLSELSAL